MLQQTMLQCITPFDSPQQHAEECQGISAHNYHPLHPRERDNLQ